MRLTHVIQIYKSLFPMQNGINGLNILNADSYKSFSIHYNLWGKFSKRILTYLYTLNLMKLTLVIQIYKSMFHIKNGINSINIFHKGSHKSFLIHYGVWRGNFQSVFYHFYIALNTKKLTYVQKSCFGYRITQKISGILWARGLYGPGPDRQNKHEFINGPAKIK